MTNPNTPAGRDGLSGAQQEMLSYALDLVEQRDFSRSGRLTDDDRAVLAELRHMAAETQQQAEPGRRDALMQAHTALAEQAGRDQATLARVRAALASFDDRGVMRIGGGNLDIPTAGEVLTAVRTALNAQPSVAPGGVGAEAHPPTHTWKVESPRRDQWASWGATHDERVWAAASYEDVIGVAPQRPFRLVHATTTYTVEAEHTPEEADGA